MNATENLMIRNMIRQQRYLNGRNWPGKTLNAPAVTRYPNILSEIDASGMCLWCPAQHAGVSKEIMAAVLEDNEELSILELCGLCALYRCKRSYLCAPTIQIVNPATNRGKVRLRQLSSLIKQVDGLEVFSMWSIEQTRDAMERGERVTYAAWRQACQNSMTRCGSIAARPGRQGGRRYEFGTN